MRNRKIYRPGDLLYVATESFAQGKILKGLLHLAGAASDVYSSLGGASVLKLGAKKIFRKVVNETADNYIQNEIGISPKPFTKAISSNGIQGEEGNGTAPGSNF